MFSAPLNKSRCIWEVRSPRKHSGGGGGGEKSANFLFAKLFVLSSRDPAALNASPRFTRRWKIETKRRFKFNARTGGGWLSVWQNPSVFRFFFRPARRVKTKPEFESISGPKTNRKKKKEAPYQILGVPSVCVQALHASKAGASSPPGSGVEIWIII